MRVLLITGGNEFERQFSRRSAEDITASLRDNGVEVHEVVLTDTRTLSENDEKIVADAAQNVDVMLPLIHGELGGAGELQRYLSTLGPAYVGGNPDGLRQAWNKMSFKQFCDENGLPTAPWKRVGSTDEIQEFGFPSVLKRAKGEFSNDVLFLKSEESLASEPVLHMMRSSDERFVERFIDGPEVTVGVLDGSAFPVMELGASPGAIFGAESKLKTLSSPPARMPFAPSLSESARKRCQDIALAVHEKLQLGSISRMDFMVENDAPYCLEMNTVMGLYTSALFPISALSAGISYPDLILKILAVAKNKPAR